MNGEKVGFVPEWPAPRWVKAFVTERGGETGRYGGGNVALHVGDERERVLANRARLRALLGLPREPVWLEQVHGARVLDLDRDTVSPADAAVTSKPGVVCAVMSADCLPVIFCDSAGTRVGVAHAGWRGLLAGVLTATASALRAPAAELMAWLGPAIGPSAYEVGSEVRDAFLVSDPETLGCFERNARGRFQADLYALARRSLACAGLTAVYGGGFCTFAETGRFYSHRREGPCGRMATLVWLDHGR